MPPALKRRAVARAWGVPPWAVDEAPADEVELEYALLRVEHEAAERRRRG